jgi:predicted ABC-type ATPase
VPDFTIIAGPNGAGKSSFSKLLSDPGSLIFDADIVKAIKEKEYPDLPDESIQMMITSAYWQNEDEAIEANFSLTVETNLRDDFLINRLEYFKSKGYTTNLIFMMLPHVDASLERVNLRVFRKGHFVDFESIKYNFETSLITLKKYFTRFDSFQLLDSSSTVDIAMPETLLMLKNNSIHFIDPNPPSWAKSTLDEITKNLPTN